MREQMKTRDDHIDFLRMNGVRVAACAWNGFQAKGRGLVCVLCELENELLRTVPFDFLPEADADKFFKPWVGSKESRMLAAYDPATEVVVCFMRKGKGDSTDIDSYKIKTRPAPPAAAELE